jgi:hypothetical protein
VAPHGSNRVRRSRFLAALIVLFALALRCFYIADSKVDGPIIGDINQYVLYAWNLAHFDTFSSAVPISSHPVVPDSYRGPGYPAFLALVMRATGDMRLGLKDVGEGRHALIVEPSTWINHVYFAQAVLGSLSVFLTMLIARFWLSEGSALAAGLITALWPHLVVFSAVMLSETIYGAVLLCALWLLFMGRQRASAGAIAASGGTFGLAYLVNPVMALFPPIVAITLAAGRQWRLAIVFMLAYIVAPLAWTVRNTQLPPASSGAFQRLAQTFVPGSWPQYFDALRQEISDDEARHVLASESEEERLLISDPANGLAVIARRMSADPVRFVSWYLMQKPFLLWDWGIRNGWGDIYFLTTERSPYERLGALKALKQAFAFFNPAVFLLAMLACVGVVVKRFRHARCGFEISIFALLLTYVTAVHVLTAAEPRYAIPYRFEEVLLAITALVWVGRRLRSTASRNDAALAA